MKSIRPHLFALVAGAALLAGCATPPPPNPAAEIPHCYKTNKGRTIACTSAPVPSLNADADAKRFAPDPSALTVFVVRRNWADGRNFVKVYSDGGPGVETLPNTMIRLKFKPGAHVIAFEFEGKRQSITVEGKAGDVRFVRIDGTVWSWKSSYEWAAEPEASIRERGVVCGKGRNPTLRLWPAIFSGEIDVFPGDRRSRLISSMTSVAPA